MRGSHSLHFILLLFTIPLLIFQSSAQGSEVATSLGSRSFVSVLSNQTLRCISPPKVCRWLASNRPDHQEVMRIRSGIAHSVPLIQFYARHLAINELPSYYALIPYIESRNNPAALSEKGALGVWQIMPETAKDLGLFVGSVDMRKNVIRSSSLVMALLKDLHAKYKGNIVWVLAAYNWGPSRVDRLIRSNSVEISSFPRETSQYIKRFFATWIAIKQRGIRDFLGMLPNADYLEVKPTTFSPHLFKHDSNLLKVLNASRRPRDPWLVPSRAFYLYYHGTYLTSR